MPGPYLSSFCTSGPSWLSLVFIVCISALLFSNRQEAALCWQTEWWKAGWRSGAFGKRALAKGDVSVHGLLRQWQEGNLEKSGSNNACTHHLLLIPLAGASLEMELLAEWADPQTVILAVDASEEAMQSFASRVGAERKPVARRSEEAAADLRAEHLQWEVQEASGAEASLTYVVADIFSLSEQALLGAAEAAAEVQGVSRGCGPGQLLQSAIRMEAKAEKEGRPQLPLGPSLGDAPSSASADLPSSTSCHCWRLSIWDHRALEALPPSLWQRYAEKLSSIARAVMRSKQRCSCQKMRREHQRRQEQQDEKKGEGGAAAALQSHQQCSTSMLILLQRPVTRSSSTGSSGQGRQGVSELWSPWRSYSGPPYEMAMEDLERLFTPLGFTVRALQPHSPAPDAFILTLPHPVVG